MAGNFLVASYTHPGKIIEISRDGKVVWDYTAAGEGGLNRPSLAIELPNGNIMANDDLNHRIIVVDKATKKILWQYGVTGQRGSAPGYLAIPDGLDIIKARRTEMPPPSQDRSTSRWPPLLPAMVVTVAADCRIARPSTRSAPSPATPPSIVESGCHAPRLSARPRATATSSFPTSRAERSRATTCRSSAPASTR